MTVTCDSDCPGLPPGLPVVTESGAPRPRRGRKVGRGGWGEFGPGVGCVAAVAGNHHDDVTVVDSDGQSCRFWAGIERRCRGHGMGHGQFKSQLPWHRADATVTVHRHGAVVTACSVGTFMIFLAGSALHYSAWPHPTRSLWVLRLPDTASQVRARPGGGLWPFCGRRGQQLYTLLCIFVARVKQS